MGLFSKFKKEKTAVDWSNAYTATPKFYAKPDGSPFGAMHFGSKISREEITKKVNQSKYEKYCYITNRLRREQFPLGLFKYSSKIENYICSILCIRYIF